MGNPRSWSTDARTTREKKIDLDANEVVNVAIYLQRAEADTRHSSIDVDREACMVAAAMIVSANRISARRSDG